MSNAGTVYVHPEWRIACADCDCKARAPEALNEQEAVYMFRVRGWGQVGELWLCEECLTPYTVRTERAI